MIDKEEWYDGHQNMRQYAENEYGVSGEQAVRAYMDLTEKLGAPEPRHLDSVLDLISQGEKLEAAVSIAAVDIERKLEPGS